jgi:hypothetical protein
MKNRVVMARFDPATGALALDGRFGSGPAGPGMVMNGVPHGAVFSRR